MGDGGWGFRGTQVAGLGFGRMEVFGLGFHGIEVRGFGLGGVGVDDMEVLGIDLDMIELGVGIGTAEAGGIEVSGAEVGGVEMGGIEGALFTAMTLSTMVPGRDSVPVMGSSLVGCLSGYGPLIPLRSTIWPSSRNKPGMLPLSAAAQVLFAWVGLRRLFSISWVP